MAGAGGATGVLTVPPTVVVPLPPAGEPATAATEFPPLRFALYIAASALARTEAAVSAGRSATTPTDSVTPC